MNVLRAPTLGMCFGVRDALATAFAHPDPTSVTIHGDLVHNDEVRERLDALGYRITPERSRAALPSTESVMITAHGISDTERDRLRAAGKTLLDTTCPLVGTVHEAARRLRDEGRLVVVLGRHGHVEVQGIVGDLDRHAVVSCRDDVRRWPDDRIGIVCQTTMPESEARALAELVTARNPTADVRFADTVCAPTKRRQESLHWLAARVDTVVVVGGGASHNTRQLVRSCEALGLRALHVRDRSELRPEWFAGCIDVGLTAGTSTPPWTVDDVEHALAAL